MTIKWASFVFWNFLNPVFYAHHRFTRRKVVVDRYLERSGFFVTAGLGVMFGGAAYLAAASYLPGSGVPAGFTVEEGANVILRAMGMESNKEFPVFTLLRAKAEIMTKLHSAMDRIEVRKQREAVEAMKRQMEELRASSSQAKVSPSSV
jgi:hypothetical protein